MKYIIVIALLVFSIACNHHNGTTRTEKIEDNNKIVRIEDDGKTLNMKVRTRNTENPVDFNESFDIREMNEKEIKKLKTHILDSLNKKK